MYNNNFYCPYCIQPVICPFAAEQTRSFDDFDDYEDDTEATGEEETSSTASEE
jgi:hypothetical protein